MFKMGEIMQIQVDYYTNLYTERVIFNENDECDEFCGDMNIPKSLQINKKLDNDNCAGSLLCI